MAHKFDVVNSVIGYDHERKRWVYDCKYDLIDGWWTDPRTKEQLFKLSERDKQDIKKAVLELGPDREMDDLKFL